MALAGSVTVSKVSLHLVVANLDWARLSARAKCVRYPHKTDGVLSDSNVY
jgi:hypothetical protein